MSMVVGANLVLNKKQELCRELLDQGLMLRLPSRGE
jgi:hypothetical protein